jgi:hypothetical protein
MPLDRVFLPSDDKGFRVQQDQEISSGVSLPLYRFHMGHSPGSLVDLVVERSGFSSLALERAASRGL